MLITLSRRTANCQPVAEQVYLTDVGPLGAVSYRFIFYLITNNGLWNPEVQCHIHKDSPIIPILTQTNPIPRIDTYSLNIHYNNVLPSKSRPS